MINGSTITLRSADNYDALRGGKYNFIVLDEFADMNPEAWFSVLRPTLSDMQGHALFIGSPKGRNHFYDLWIDAGVLEDWESISVYHTARRQCARRRNRSGSAET